MKAQVGIPTALMFPDGDEFASNIENLWGYKEVLIAGPKTTSNIPAISSRPVATSILMMGPLPLKPSDGTYLYHAGPLLKRCSWVTTQPPSIFIPMSDDIKIS